MVPALTAGAGLDVGSLITQGLVSLLTPTLVLAPFLIRYWRRKLAAEARDTEANADETDARAEITLSGEALDLFRTARTDQASALEEAREARAEAAQCRRQAVELWAKLDAFDRWARQMEAEIRQLGGAVPNRPLDLDHPLT